MQQQDYQIKAIGLHTYTLGSNFATLNCTMQFGTGSKFNWDITIKDHETPESDSHYYTTQTVTSIVENAYSIDPA